MYNDGPRDVIYITLLLECMKAAKCCIEHNRVLEVQSKSL